MLKLLTVDRYRRVPPFGRGTIRRFHANAHAMKKLAGRDFEDLLQVSILFTLACQTYLFSDSQCSIPVFEGLLQPAHDNVIRELLFELAMWHALAKLRLHTDTTISSLEHSTRRLGIAIRNFELETCSQLEARDLPSEDAARARWQAAKLASGKTTREPVSLKAKPRKFNTETYKLHALGHYADAIRRFGPSDGFSTQTVSTQPFNASSMITSTIQGEAEHQRVKRRYKRASKSNFTHGIAKLDHRERVLHQIGEQQILRDAVDDPSSDEEELPATAPEVHHQMSFGTKDKLELPIWLKTNKKDPACEVSPKAAMVEHV